MTVEYLQLPRQGGKTRYLAERVAELQDEGHDLVVVVTHDHREAHTWYDLCFDIGIDPSRFMLLSPHVAKTARGHRYVFAGIDNADLIKDLGEITRVVCSSATNTDIVVTYTNPNFNKRRLIE